MENPENQAKMLETCFLKIAISQDWVNEFQISQSLWVREALEHILRLSRFHNSCKHNFCVTKTPKIHLFFQFHITGTVGMRHFLLKRHEPIQSSLDFSFPL